MYALLIYSLSYRKLLLYRFSGWNPCFDDNKEPQQISSGVSTSSLSSVWERTVLLGFQYISTVGLRKGSSTVTTMYQKTVYICAIMTLFLGWPNNCCLVLIFKEIIGLIPKSFLSCAIYFCHVQLISTSVKTLFLGWPHKYCEPSFCLLLFKCELRLFLFKERNNWADPKTILFFFTEMNKRGDINL